MSVSKEKNAVVNLKICERLLRIGKDYLSGDTNAAIAQLASMGTLEFTDAFYLLDKLGPSLSRREQRLLLDLLTEIVVLSQLDMGMDQRVLRGEIKTKIKDTGHFGEFIYQVIEQINGSYNT
ncbi:MAG: hypothetical protein ACXADB_00765 [Candidatus Hermodarchaeia archaeon]|jgi:hypothetical protein